MIPEALLVLALIIVFFADFCLHKSERKVGVLGKLTAALLLCQTIMLTTVGPAEAFGGMYVAGQAAQVMKLILTFGTFIVVVMAEPWLENEARRYAGEFHLLVLSTLLGMYIMMSSGSFLIFFLGLETASVPMACLVAFDKFKKQSAEAAAKYILVATFSSGVMLYGISFIYAATGTLYFNDVATALGNRYMFSPLQLMGLVFFFSGLAFKLSLVPFHFWTADTYEGAPTPITGYLSVCSKGAAAFAALVILVKAFGPMIDYWEYMLYVVIVLSITIANLFAIHQKDLKRFMAFSSISQAGYIMLAVVGDSAMGVTALSYYVLIYVVANLAVFSIISSVEEHNNGVVSMDAYNGFYKTNPRLAFLMTLALFSLGGIPPFAGMFSKFFVFMAAANGAQVTTTIGATIYAVVFIALVNTVVSLYYYLLIVKAMFIKHNENPLPTFSAHVNTKLALALCTLGIIAFGVCSYVYDWIQAASVMQ